MRRSKVKTCIWCMGCKCGRHTTTNINTLSNIDTNKNLKFEASKRTMANNETQTKMRTMPIYEQ